MQFVSYFCTVNAVQENFAKISTIHSILHNTSKFVHILLSHLVLQPKLKFYVVIILTSVKKLEEHSSIPLYRFVCLIHKTLNNLHSFTSVISFQCMDTSLHCKLPISNFLLIFPLPLQMQGTTQYEISKIL